MSWNVYILFSKKDHMLYTGCTLNLKQRLAEHNSGKVPATKNRKPLVLIHQEQFENKSDAFNRERFLKSLWSSRFKKKVLQCYLDKVGLKPIRQRRI